MNRSKAKQTLIDMLCNIKNADEMRYFLEQILTAAEVNDLLDRIRIYQTLTCTEMPQRNTAKSLNVSISKVTRGASNLRDQKAKSYWKSKFSGFN
ncbi:trp operon repressor [Polynucleobacter sinensis]|jgi:TrpR family trp operon transcriptional repressor|uniref:trp operon repressor n=1 Tax=Polynucleobacter sinensis TaxID=1743157 RepID=UPI000782F99A|nr:trp operon repressor [Polynucleobacter sinensis]